MFKEGNADVIRQLEQKLLSVADLCLYSNKMLMSEEQAMTDGRAVHLDHGVDSTLFSYLPDRPVPHDLAGIRGPIIGFFGNLRAYMVDFALIAHIAREIPEASVVLVGDSQDSTDELKAIENIHLLGMKPHAEIPAYGARFDVALIPYRINDWTRYCNPIKIKEYLALGLQVVSTDYPEAYNYADRIEIAGEPDEMVKAIRRCLAEPAAPQDRQRFRASVVDQTWDDRTRRLSDHVSALADA